MFAKCSQGSEAASAIKEQPTPQRRPGDPQCKGFSSALWMNFCAEYGSTTWVLPPNKPQFKVLSQWEEAS